MRGLGNLERLEYVHKCQQPKKEMDSQELYEFPVIIQDTRDIVTLFVTNDERERAVQDEAYLMSLVAKEQAKNNIGNTTEHTNEEVINVDNNNADTSKIFVWPDKTIYLLLELYREKEEEFTGGNKHANKVWAEIAQQMKDTNPLYNVTAQQCTTELSGLKRTYKHIIDQNKKSGNQRISWTLFPTMDALFGNRASTRSPAIATSDGPADPYNVPSTSSTMSPSSPPHDIPSTSLVMIPSPCTTNPPQKRKRIETMIEEFVTNSAAERKEMDEERKHYQARRKQMHEQNRQERKERHNEQMEVQKSLVSILQQFLHKP